MTKQMKRSTGRWAAGTLVAMLAASLVAAQSYGPAVGQGSALTPAAAQQIETSLIANPHDLYARARLLGYYSSRAGQDPASRLGRLRQVEWLIENVPASLLLRNQAVQLRPSDFAPPYGAYLESLRTAWQKQVDQRPNDTIVIENACQSFAGVEFGLKDLRAPSAAEYLSGGTFAEYLKRLRRLEPGDPEWALDLAGIYWLALFRASVPGAPGDAKRLATIIQAELGKSDDVAVIAWTGLMLYQRQEISMGVTLGGPLLRRAAALNPKNLAWARALSAGAPNGQAEFSAALTTMLQETDLWPGGVVPMMTVPPGAIRMAPADEAARRPPLMIELPPTVTVVGTACSARFDALIGRDGKIKNLQVVAFDHLSIPFIGAARDALRQAQYGRMLVDGQPVEVVTQIDVKCPTK